MRAEIIKLRSSIDTTFLYVTHDQTEAMTLGDRIVIMRDGFIQQIGTPQEVYYHPTNLFVAGFIGTPQMNFFHDVALNCTNGDYSVTILGREFKLADEQQAILRKNGQRPGKVIAGVRPVHIALAQDGLNATIEVSEMMGSEMYLHLRAGEDEVVAVIPTTDIDFNATKIGASVRFAFNPELMQLFDPETEESLLK